jgi:hypothetical protein
VRERRGRTEGGEGLRASCAIALLQYTTAVYYHTTTVYYYCYCTWATNLAARSGDICCSNAQNFSEENMLVYIQYQYSSD